METILDDINHNLNYIALVPIDYDPKNLAKLPDPIKLHLQIIHLDEGLIDKLEKIYGSRNFSNYHLLYLNVYYRKALRIHYERKDINTKPMLKHKENNQILVNALHNMKKICRRLKISSSVEKTSFSINLLKPDDNWSMIYLDLLDIFGERIGEYDCEEEENIQVIQLFKVLRKVFMIWSGTKLVKRDDLILVKPDSLAVKCLKL